MNSFVFINLVCITEDGKDVRNLSIGKPQIALESWVMGADRRQIKHIADSSQRAVDFVLQLADELLFVAALMSCRSVAHANCKELWTEITQQPS